MPIKSKAQWRFLASQQPKRFKSWLKEHPVNYDSLPEHSEEKMSSDSLLGISDMPLSACSTTQTNGLFGDANVRLYKKEEKYLKNMMDGCWITKCSECDTTIATCRCSHEPKTIDYKVCDDCKKSLKESTYELVFTESKTNKVVINKYGKIIFGNKRCIKINKHGKIL